jgi:hypothetical protein
VRARLLPSRSTTRGSPGGLFFLTVRSEKCQVLRTPDLSGSSDTRPSKTARDEFFEPAGAPFSNFFLRA